MFWMGEEAFGVEVVRRWDTKWKDDGWGVDKVLDLRECSH